MDCTYIVPSLLYWPKCFTFQVTYSDCSIRKALYQPHLFTHQWGQHGVLWHGVEKQGLKPLTCSTSWVTAAQYSIINCNTLSIILIYLSSFVWTEMSDDLRAALWQTALHKLISGQSTPCSCCQAPPHLQDLYPSLAKSKNISCDGIYLRCWVTV